MSRGSLLLYAETACAATPLGKADRRLRGPKPILQITGHPHVNGRALPSQPGADDGGSGASGEVWSAGIGVAPSPAGWEPAVPLSALPARFG